MIVILLIIIIAAEPQIVLFCIGIIYLLSGLLLHVKGRLKSRKVKESNISMLDAKKGGKCEK